MSTENSKIKGDSNSATAPQRNGHRVLVRFIKFFNVLALTAFFYFIWMHYYSQQVYFVPFYRRGNLVVGLLYAVIYYSLAHMYHGFYLHISKISDIILDQVLAAVLDDAILYLVTVLLVRRLPNVLPMFLCLAIDIVVIALWAKLAHDWYFRHYSSLRAAVIYDEMEGLDSLIQDNGLDIRYDVRETIPITDLDFDNLDHQLSGYQVVFLACIHSHERNQIVKYCVEKDISAFVIPRIGDVIMSGADKLHLMHLPMLLVGRYNPKPEYLFIKRLCDIVLSGTVLVVLSPLMIILALIIRSDGGTAFYRQVRLTKDGKEFEVLKFRSMRMDAEKDGVARLSTGENDPRITKVGRFIRACRMDELPQLLNILKGDMSIVGPRPERPEIAKEYEKDLPEFKLRLQCKCGLTGYAQVYGKYNSTPYDKLLMDLMYISKPSLAEDLKIIFATIKILFKKDSTEGIAEGQTTANDKKSESA